MIEFEVSVNRFRRHLGSTFPSKSLNKSPKLRRIPKTHIRKSRSLTYSGYFGKPNFTIERAELGIDQGNAVLSVEPTISFPLLSFLLTPVYFLAQRYFLGPEPTLLSPPFLNIFVVTVEENLGDDMPAIFARTRVLGVFEP